MNNKSNKKICSVYFEESEHNSISIFFFFFFFFKSELGLSEVGFLLHFHFETIKLFLLNIVLKSNQNRIKIESNSIYLLFKVLYTTKI